MISLLLILISYILLIFIIPRFCIPYLGFRKAKIRPNIPLELEARIKEISKYSKTNYQLLKNSYDFITSEYHGHRLETVFKFNYLFKDPLEFKAGYIPCTVQNYLLRTMLVKSNRFNDEDIKLKTMPFDFFIHQYLRVRIDNKWITVDPWAKHLGVPFGKKPFLFR